MIVVIPKKILDNVVTTNIYYARNPARLMNIILSLPSYIIFLEEYEMSILFIPYGDLLLVVGLCSLLKFCVDIKIKELIYNDEANGILKLIL